MIPVQFDGCVLGENDGGVEKTVNGIEGNESPKKDLRWFARETGDSFLLAMPFFPLRVIILDHATASSA